MIAEPEWVDARVTAHIYNYEINEVRSFNLADPETKALVDAGLLEIVDEETRARRAPPVLKKSGGCGCGQ